MPRYKGFKIPMQRAELIKIALKTKGMTQRELAELCGVCVMSINSALNQRYNISYKLYKSIKMYVSEAF